MRITRKLGLLVALPLVAVLAFAALAVVTTGGETVRAEQLRQLVVASAEAGELAHQLQRERATATLALSGGSAEALDQFGERVLTTEVAIERYQLARADLPALPAGTGALVERIDRQLTRLGGIHDQVLGGRGKASAVAFTYRILIADLIGLRESVAQGAPADVADQLRAAAALSDAAEQVGRQQVAVLRVLEFGRLTPAASQEITAARGTQVEALLTFDRLAEPGWRAAVERTAVGAEALAAKQMEDQAARTPVGRPIAVDPVEWTAALDQRMLRLREAEALVDGDILAEVTALRNARLRLTGGQVTAVVLAMAAAVVLTVLLGRPVVSGLRQLRDAAHEVAYQRLPRAVRQLDDSEALGGLTPEQFADRTEPPVRVRGRDELAEVGAAFNVVSREAIRTAAEQARLRVSVAAIMRNLARRGQKLTDRLTATLDEVERDELNPQRLSQLYELDLLATLLGGTNESLLVLGEAGAAQVRTADEHLADVLRAAQGRVEQYHRTELGVIDEGVSVRASAVDDVVKLLAELLDNACRYSSPKTVVRLDARWLSDRIIVQITDEGIGIDPERRRQLNHRLSHRPPLDLAAVEAMGLTVVAYLASRYQIQVELKEAYPRGVIAEVTLPPALVAIRSAHRRAVAPLAAVTAGGSAQAAGKPAVSPAPPAAPLFQTRSAADLSRASAPNGDASTGVPSGTETPTQELRPVIYDEVKRSRWFTPAGESDSAPATGVSDRRAESTWRTAADSGWRAAAQAATPKPDGTTHNGLPMRRPGAQLVPGAVETTDTAEPDDWRDPARVGAVAAAYSRGLATGRARQPAVAQPQGAITDRNGEPAT